jgi:hypothetical protein
MGMTMPDNWLEVCKWIMEPILNAEAVKAFVAQEMAPVGESEDEVEKP